MAATKCISIFFKERATASESYQRAETVKENVQLAPNIFFYIEDCVAASRNTSTFFKERAAASAKISMNDCF